MGAVLAARATAPPGAHPKVGEKAPDFALEALDGGRVRLSEELAGRPVVVVVLRGWPGYDCPFCTRQFADYVAHGSDFERSGARVLFVYPGPGGEVREHAAAFTASKAMPAAFRVLLDPDYVFTQAYGLRWDAPKETAYPATFVLDRRGAITFAQVSAGHGDRVPATAVLEAIAAVR